MSLGCSGLGYGGWTWAGLRPREDLPPLEARMGQLISDQVHLKKVPWLNEMATLDCKWYLLNFLSLSFATRSWRHVVLATLEALNGVLFWRYAAPENENGLAASRWKPEGNRGLKFFIVYRQVASFSTPT